MRFKETNKSFLRRVAIMVVVVLSVSAGLVYNLMVMQVEENGRYSKLADNNRSRFVTVTPPRGILYDRNEHPLAVNRTLYRLEVTPSLVDDMEEMLQRLRGVIRLNDEELQEFRRKVAGQASFTAATLKMQLSEQDLANFAVERHWFPGVEVMGELGRYYPRREVFSHAVGYIGALSARDWGSVTRKDYKGIRHIGKVGLEKRYEESLRGKSGVRVVESDAQGRFIRDISKSSPRPGQDLLLTLDSKLQTTAYQALGDHEGAVVALDPRNGDVLALVSKPGFDPNDFFRGFDRDKYQAMLASPRRHFFNRATSGQYSPGSIIKLIVALAGLDHGLTSRDYSMYAGRYFSVPGNTRRFHDWRPEGHGWVDLRDSITQSCDIFFYDLAYRAGIDRLYDAFVAFGLGNPSGVDMLDEAPGLVPSPSWKREQLQMPWFEEETVIVGIGQGYFLVTPIQLAVLAATIANRGSIVKPRLVQATREHAGKGWKFNPPVVVDTVEYASEDWQLVVDAMVDTMHKPNGTGYHVGFDAGYTIAGKTGTVQTHSISAEERANNVEITEKHLKDHAMFIAFAPADDPVIAVAVTVEHVGGGSEYAAPIARQLLDVYFGQSTAMLSTDSDDAG